MRRAIKAFTPEVLESVLTTPETKFAADYFEDSRLRHMLDNTRIDRWKERMKEAGWGVKELALGAAIGGVAIVDTLSLLLLQH